MRKSIYYLSSISIMLFLLCVCLFPISTNLFASTQQNITYRSHTPDSINNLSYQNELILQGTKNGTNYVYIVDSNYMANAYSTGDIIPYDVSFTSNQIIFTAYNYYVHILDIADNEITNITSYYDTNNNGDGLTNHKYRKVLTTHSGVTYFIWENTIATLNKTDSNYSLKHFATLTYNDSPLNFTQGAFFIDEKEEFIYFTIAGDIYKLSTTSKIVTKLDTTQAFTDISYLTIDNLGNIYIVDNKVLTKITSTSREQASLSQYTTACAIDLVSGKTYTLENGIVKYSQFKDSNNNSFVSALCEQALPVNINNVTPSNTIHKIVKVNPNTPLYTYRSVQKTTFVYEDYKNLLVLDESDTDFYYVYDSSFDNSLNYQTGFVKKSDCIIQNSPLSQEFATNNKARVVVEKSKVYTLPTSLYTSTTTPPNSIGTLNYGTIVTILANINLLADANNVTFVAIQYALDNQNVIGYIDSRTILNTNDETLALLDKPNATLRAETIVYQEKELQTQIDTLDKNTDVKVISSNNGVTKIQYFVNNESEQIVKVGYVKSSFVNTGNLSTSQILGIVLMVVSLVCAVIIAIIIRHRNKKQAQ